MIIRHLKVSYQVTMGLELGLAGLGALSLHPPGVQEPRFDSKSFRA